MKRWSQLWVGVLATVGCASCVGVLPAAAKTYHSPGYVGTSKPVATQPAPALPVVSVGSGNDPSVVVDAAGTAHIAWTTDDGAQADALHYCRLPRGAKTCATTATLRPEPSPAPSDYDPAYNIESGGPQLYVLGSQLVMVSHRISTSGFSHPDGSLGATTLIYVSQDGGSSWSPVNGVPEYGIVGTSGIGGPGVAYGSDSDPKIGVISALDSDGTFFQELSPGAFTSQSALLGSTLSQGSGGSVALDAGGLPVAAFHGSTNGTIDIRRFMGTGSANDVANWGSTQTVSGNDPQLAGGPSGLYLLDQAANASHFSVHRVNIAAGTGDPKIIEAAGPQISEDNANDGYLTEGPDGSLYSAWEGPTGLRMNSARNGAGWATAQGTTIEATKQDINETQLGVASDGGGFVVIHQNGGTDTEAKILAVPFGTQTATGQTGLGDLPGGQGDAGVSEGCRTVTFGPVKAQVETGCFLKGAKGAVNDEVSDGAVTVNGVTIAPSASAGTASRRARLAAPTQIIVNAHTGTIDSTGPVTVSMAGAAPAIVIWNGPIHLDLHGVKVGDTLFDFPPQGHQVDGFPVKGDIVVKIAAGFGVAVPLAADLPDWASGFSAGATLTGNSQGGLNQGSLELKIPDMPLGALELTDVDITYDPLTDAWSGHAKLDIPQGGAGFTATLDITFQKGQLTHAAFDTEIPPPGIPVYTDVYVHDFHGSFGADPFSLSIGGRVGFYLPTGITNFPVDLDGTLTATFGPPDVFSLNGDLDIFGIPVGSGQTTIAFDPFSFDTKVDFDLFGISGGGEIYVDPPHFGGSGNFDIAGLDVSAAASDTAIAGCVATKHLIKVHAGLLYPWGGSLQLLLGSGGCDLGQAVRAAIRRDLITPRRDEPADGTPVTGATFSVAANRPYVDVNVQTADGAPALTLRDPNGQTVTPVPVTGDSTTDPGGSPAILTMGSHAVVMLPHPVAGTWTVLADPGAPAFTAVASAAGVTPPAFSAHLLHTGRRLTVKYKLTRRPGVTVSFIERGRRLTHTLRTAPGGSGSFTLTPAPGPGGRRTVEAIVQDGGVPQAHPVIGTFTAPDPARPAAPAKLTVTTRGHGFRIRLLAAPGATTRLRIAFSDGRTLAENLKPGVHTLTLPALGYTDRVQVTATSIGAVGTASRAVRASGRYPAPVRKVRR